MTTPADRRERTRLRSERWRRAHGIMPRRRRVSIPFRAIGRFHERALTVLELLKLFSRGQFWIL